MAAHGPYHLRRRCAAPVSCMRVELDFLDGCLAVLQDLRAGVSPASLISPASGAPSATLNLRSITVDTFAVAVRERPLASDVQDALISLFERAVQRLKTTFSQHFTDAQSRWGASRAHALPLLHELFETQCAMAVQETQETILGFVDERLDAYMAEANASHPWPRPHNAKAIAILETAFQHAPNITQAEKYKLADATGLQPRQVTIWVRVHLTQFQNRRNRRTGSRRPLKRVGGRSPAARPRTPPSLAPVPLARRKDMPETVASSQGSSELSDASVPVPPTSADASAKVELGLDAPGVEWAPSSPEPLAPMDLPLLGPPPPCPIPEPVANAPAALSLDDLLVMDNARQCLVFSPLDPLPRLDFADLHLDLETLEHALGLARPSPSLPSLCTIPSVPYDELAAAQALMAQPLSVADEIVAHAQAEGWSFGDLVTPMRMPPGLHATSELERLAVHLEGHLHSPLRQRYEPMRTSAPVTGPPRWLPMPCFGDPSEAGVAATGK